MKKIMMSFLLVSPMSQASVNLQTGGWVWSENISGIEINYNSRSLHQGWWGQGWCSDLDAEVLKDNNGKHQFYYCSKKISETKVNYRLSGSKVIYLGKVFLFDNQYRLVSINSPSTTIRINYEENRIEHLKINSIEWNVKTLKGLKRITELASHSSMVRLLYTNDLLVGIRANNENIKSFEYDPLDNMVLIATELALSRRRLAQIFYSPNDRVSQVTSANSCQSFYDFDEQKKDSQVLLISKIHRNCKGWLKTSYTKAYSSRFKLSGRNDLKLVEVKEIYL